MRRAAPPDGRRRLFGRLVLVAGLAVLATGASACPAALSGRTLAIAPTAHGFGAIQKLPSLPLEAGEYVLTIDDGPNPRTTPALLAILQSRCVEATFFLVGRNAEKHPELVRRIREGGSAIGSHSYSHPDFGKLTRLAAAAEIWNGIQAAETAADAHPDPSGAPKFFRFPGSASLPPALRPDLVSLANATGAIVVGYDFSPEDWRNSPPEESYRRLLSRMGDRGIILFHDGQSNTIELLPMVLDELARRNARIVALAPAR